MIKITNKNIRLLWLKSNLLNESPIKKFDLLQIIKNLAFVQLDTIQNVTRAHHHILWSRNKNYKEHMLDDLLLKKESIFEYFTHDASVVPVEYYPMCEENTNNVKLKLNQSAYYKDALKNYDIQTIINRIKKEGALCTKDFNSKIIGEKKMWDRPPHKVVLDYMWHCGLLNIAYRKKFIKYYDLKDNIIPVTILNKHLTKNEQINWLCNKALNTMSVASVKEIKEFWGFLSIKEVNTWIIKNKENILEVQWENNEGKYINSYAIIDLESKLDKLKISNSKLQIINPFDPAIRDRKRLKYIFGFDYKIEIFVPKIKRIYGYYVYPILEGSEFIARIELQANRKENILSVVNFWVENKIIWDNNKKLKLDEELEGFALFVGITNINWLCEINHNEY